MGSRITRQKIAICCLSLMVAIFFSACSSSQQSGMVTGVFESVGGPPGANPSLDSGTVYFKGPLSTYSVHELDGQFDYRLPTGTYRVSGRSPQFDSGRISCPGGIIHVSAMRITVSGVSCPRV